MWKPLNSGPWIAAFGTVLSAVGSTPSKKITKDMRKALDLWGIVLQAAGNTLQADTEEDVTLEKIGNEIQAVGNISVIAGMIINFEEETQQKLIITGNWIQALGGLLAFAHEIEEPDSKPGHDQAKAYDVIGNILQVIGDSIQARGGIEELKGNKNQGKALNVSGSWIQVVGSVLSAIGETKDDQNKKAGSIKEPA